MIHLLYTIIATQMLLTLALLFKSPLRKLVIMALDRLKRGKGPVMVKTVGSTVFVVLLSSVHSIININQRVDEAGAVNPTDQVLMARHLLEASLMGFLLFLSLMIDRLHHYIRELYLLRKSMEAAKKQTRSFEETKSGNAAELNTMTEESTKLKTNIKNLEVEWEKKAKDVNVAKSNAEALKKQSEGFCAEYDRLLEENKDLRYQLQSMEQSLSQSGSK